MEITKKLRTVKRISDDGTKTEVRMKELVGGDIFEVYESDGTQVGGQWIADSDAAFSDKDDCYSVLVVDKVEV